MNGAVSFESAPGEGTVFHIDLPAQTRVSTDAIDPAALHAPSQSGARHLLHVDDDPDTLRLVASAFEGSLRGALDAQLCRRRRRRCAATSSTS